MGFSQLLYRKLIVNGLAAWPAVPSRVRARLYRWGGIDVQTTFLSARCYFSGNRVTIGERSFVNGGCYFENHGAITIGCGVSLGMEVMLCASTHELGGPDQRAGKPIGLPIRIEDGCWIGTRAVILPGVTIGAGCVVAAGAVVSRDCAPHGLYAGTPARRVKDLPSEKIAEAVG